MRKTLFVSLLVAASVSVTSYASDVENTYKEYEGILETQGISKHFDKVSEANLINYIKIQISETELLISRSQGKKESEKFKDQLEFYKYALKTVKKNDKSQNILDSENNYFTAKKILYNVKAPEFETRKRTMGDNLETILRRGVVIKTPYGLWNKSNKAIGLSAASEEAHNLVDGDNPNFVSMIKLATMSPLEIANLDVRADNSMWHTKKYLESHPNGWEDQEKWAETQVSKKVNSKFESILNGEKFNYKIAEAQNVFIFDEVKNATSKSPKIMAKDLYGVKWKLKWGNEIQTESMANRLWMKLGGKYTDLIYTSNSSNPTLLIFSKKTALTQTDQIAFSIRNYMEKLSDEQKLEMMKQYCLEVPSLEFLETCTLLSTLHFTVKPFVLEKGVITTENVDRILNKAGTNKIISSQRENLIGREFVTFKETSLEFQNDSGIIKGGPATHSFMGATYDRVQRGLMVFNMWLRNLDVKDENNRGQIVKNYLDNDKIYLETQHDMGVTFGGLFSSGFANNFSDDNFVTEGPGMFDLAFNQFLPFIPKAWTSATFADALWMGEKIARLTRADLEEVVSASNWPSFIQKAMVAKLMIRRNHIAKALKIENLLDEKNITAPTIKYSLKNKEEIAEVAREFNLSSELIEKTLAEKKLKKYVDVVIKKGTIVSCSDSLIINLLEKNNNPSGLSRRNAKRNNHKDLSVCDFLP